MRQSIAVLQELSEGKKKRQDSWLQAPAELEWRRKPDDVLVFYGLLGTRRWMDIIKLVERLRGGRGKRNFGQIEMLGDTVNGF